MILESKRIDLFGKQFIQKLHLKSPFEYDFPIADYACFLFSLKGEMQFQIYDENVIIPADYSLLLNCFNSGKRFTGSNSSDENEMVVISFHPDILKKIYERDLPVILQKPKDVSNQSSEKINNDFLIRKYIEGLLFYFENPSLVNDEILILKLKEIILLLSQTRSASAIRTILSQLFSPASYTFRQVIEANIFSQTSVESLAQKTNLSVSSFKREFAKQYNDSPANYIKTKRLEKAAELLLISDNRITDIAFECGFNDLANFTKSFHEKYNVSPSTYRQKRPKRPNH